VKRYSVYVSQDGFDSGVAAVVKEFRLAHFQHPRDAGLENAQYIARHYKYALDKLFVDRNHSHVIILEDGS